MSRIKNFTQGMKYMLLQHVLNVISGVFIGAMVTRHYGPELFGVFSLASFYGAIVGSIAGLGVGDLLAAQLMKKKRHKRRAFLVSSVNQVCNISIILVHSLLLP